MDVKERRRVMMGMGTQASKYTATIDDSTKYLRMTAYGEKKLSRLFGFSNIEVLYMDGVISLDGPYFFEFMRALKAAIFPDVTSCASYIFWNSYIGDPIPGIDFYKKIAFPANSPFKLESGADVILRSDEMCTTSFTASIWGMPSNIKFYVPQSLVSTYLSDANWATFGSSRILPIEGSRYENLNWWKSLV